MTVTTRRKVLMGMTGLVACAPAIAGTGNTIGKPYRLHLRPEPAPSAALLNARPTYFYDPDASGSSGVGTFRNPFTTAAEIQAVLSNSQPGEVLGIKRGSYTRGTLSLAVAGASDDPFHIVPYGDDEAMPVFSGEKVRTWWRLHPGDARIWRLGGILEAVDVYDIGYAPYGQVGSRLLYVSGVDLRSKIAAIRNYIAAPVAGTAGVFAYDGTTIYAWFVDAVTQANPNLGQVVTADAEQAIYLSNGNVAAGGNIVVHGIVAWFARDNALQYTAGYSATSVDTIHILGCEAAYTGAQGAAGEGLGQVAITVYGRSQSALATDVVIKGNYCHDCQNNAVELGYTSGAIVESNVAVNICGNSIVELWTNNTNCRVLFNRGYGDVNYGLKQNTGHGSGVWATNYSDNGADTSTLYNGGHLVAFNYMQDFHQHAIDNASHNNTYLNNTAICVNLVTAGDFILCEGDDPSLAGVEFYNNLFIQDVVTDGGVSFFETRGASTPLPASSHNGFFNAGNPRAGDAAINGTYYDSLSTLHAATGMEPRSHGLYVSGQGGFGYPGDPPALDGFSLTSYWTGPDMDYALSNALPQRIGKGIGHYGIKRDVDGNPISDPARPDLGCKQFGPTDSG